jgi:hypothetical protein
MASPLFTPAQESNPAQAPAADQPNSGAQKPWWRQITTNGFLSLSYTYNTNQPEPRINQFRVFDFNDDEPQLDVAQLVIQRSINKPNQFGFLFDLTAGSGIPPVTAAYGLFRNTRTGVAQSYRNPHKASSFGIKFQHANFRVLIGVCV